MKTILLSQRKERDDLLAQSYISRHTMLNTDELLNSHLTIHVLPATEWLK